MLKRLLRALRASPEPPPSLKGLHVRVTDLEDTVAHLEERLNTLARRQGGMKRGAQLAEPTAPAAPPNGLPTIRNPLAAAILRPHHHQEE